MPKPKRPAVLARASTPSRTTAADVEAALAWLARKGTQRQRDGLARYGIAATRPFGVSMADLKVLAKRAGRDHALALALWETDRYEARLLATLVDEPERVTPAQMERWCRGFDNWAVCDTACFHLFDRTPHAWTRLAPWSRQKGEFQKRAAFALLASLALHDRETGDAPFLAALELVEPAAADERNFVKKGVSWALRAVGLRTPACRVAALAAAKRLAAADAAAPRWIGRDALREFARSPVRHVGARERAARK